ncbi:MAG: hypothetical protein R3D30_13695 [Hyphomicrobiales bacterium]
MDGLQGREARPYEALEPITAFQPYPAPGPITPPTGPDQSFMIDLDTDDGSNATKIGDVAVYQTTPAEAPAEEAPEVAELGAYPPGWPPDVPYEPGYDPAPPPPDDGWPVPPPPYLETDLAIEKSGPAQCQEGVNCTYTVKITNLGAIPYIGPLAVNDTMPPDATLAAASPGWHCDVAGQVVSCVTLGAAILDVGVSATLTLIILLPADVADDHVENCAAIDWFEMGTDDGPGDGNDHDCVDTPVTDGFDLGIQKTGPLQCVENSICTYLLLVTNFGPGEFDGVIAVHDTLPANATLQPSFFGWSCVQTDGEVECLSADLTLPSGGVEALFLEVKLPDGIAGGSVENCAAIDWPTMGADDGAADAHVDEDCHTVDVLDGAGFFDLAVEKQGPAHCDEGGNCTYTITVTNTGPDDYNGEILVQDATPAGSAFVAASPGWICLPPAITCRLAGGPHLLHPDESRSIDLTITIAAPAPGDPVINCVSFPWGFGGLPADDDPGPGGEFGADLRCVPTFIGAGFDLEIGKTGPAECYEGGICEYDVRLTNHGPNPVGGAVAFIDTLPAGAALESMMGGWHCAPDAVGTVRCSLPPFAAIPSGAIETVTLGVRLPDPVAGDTVTNCAAITWDGTPAEPILFTGDDDPATDGPACVDTPVLAADLAPFGGTVCKLGETCKLDVEIENRGGRLFKGRAGLKGTLDPAVSISAIKSLTSGLTCEVTGNGTYECEADELTLKPDDAAKIEISIAIPGDFPHERIVHRKEMVWPDAQVKDPKPENDRHTSTIMIAQPEEPAAPEEPEEEEEQEQPPPGPECVGGSIVSGECTCPKGTERKETGPNAYRCEKPPPPITCKGGTVRDGDCYCPKGTERKKTGKYDYVCETLPPPITCIDGRVDDGACICPKGYERKQTGKYAYKCEKLPPPITCKDGTVKDGVCYCPKGYERKQIDKYTYACEKPPITCKGGTAKDGVCYCPKGYDRKQTGTYAYECVAQAPPPKCDKGWTEVDRNKAKLLRLLGWDIKEVSSGGKTILCGKAPPAPVCEGGSVKNNKCYCPKGTEQKQTGPNAYKCVSTVPPLTCSGGSVKNGQCYCPKGTEKKQTGNNAYTCVSGPPVSTPQKLTCIGGRVSKGKCVCPKGSSLLTLGNNKFSCINLPTLR